MKIRFSSQTKIIANYIAQIILSNHLYQENKETDVNLQIACTELLNIYIRKVARKSLEKIFPHELLKKAIAQTKSSLTEEIYILQELWTEEDFNSSKCENIINSYLNISKDSLTEKTSKNSKKGNTFIERLATITNEFWVDKEPSQKGLNITTIKPNNCPITFELIEIGFNNSTEGILLYPLIEKMDEFAIETSYLEISVNIDGDRFPFEITFKDFLFILDDDGSIFVFVENFPEKIIAQVKESLLTLATSLYRH
ncbi:MAG: hypothetical protein WBB28_12370 [Crinalium sp.]